MAVSILQRLEALRYLSMLARLERTGLTLARRRSERLYADTITALKTGKRDVVEVALERLAPMQDLITRAMIAAFLAGMDYGRRRVSKRLELSQDPFDSSIAFWKRKLKLSNQQMTELGEIYTNEATRIVRNSSDSLERRLTRTMLKSQSEGVTVSKGAQKLRETLLASGYSPQKPYMLETIFRTQIQLAGSAGQWSADQAPEIQEILWGYQYVTFGDDRVRAGHAELDGVKLPKDDAFWNLHYPPNGWNCRCTVISLFDEPEGYLPKHPPLTVKDVDGKEVPVGADPGFAYHPFTLSNGTIAGNPLLFPYS